MYDARNMQNYAKTYAEFEFERPERFNFAGDVVDYWADPARDKQALLIVDDDGQFIERNFSDIARASKQLANVLTGAGVKRGDTIVMILGRTLPWWEGFTASLRMGAVISPGTTQLSAKDLAYRINAAAAVCVITDAANAEKVDEVAEQCESLSTKLIVGPERAGWIHYAQAVSAASEQFDTVDTASDEDAICYFTSGTTGFPKMAIHTHNYGIGHQTSGRFWLDLTPGDLHWNISDTGWAKAAWSSYFGPWNCGAALFVHNTGGFNPTRTLDLLQQYPISTMCGAPTIYRMLVKEDLDGYTFAHLRHCVGAGEPLNPEIIEVWKRDTGITIRDGYGQTETVILCGSFLCIEPRFGSMGKPAPGIDLHVIDDEGNILPPHQEGDIAVRVKPERPVGLFKGYKDNPEKTAEAFMGDWYLTGDRAYVDEEGYFWFVSRSDDVILSAGYRIGPFEVESALIEHPAVIESAVVSSPDETRGEVVKAFVVLAAEFEAGDALVKELQEHVKNVTAPYKYPRMIDFVDDLPKTVSGKIRRVDLRNKEWGRA